MQDPSHDPMRIENGKYQADVQRGGTVEPFWYYLIRRKDSNEIINIGKFENSERSDGRGTKDTGQDESISGSELAIGVERQFWLFSLPSPFPIPDLLDKFHISS
jgi:hypothetical protein